MKTVSMKMEDKLYNSIKAEAIKNNISVSAWIRILLTNAINNKLAIIDNLDILVKKSGK